MNHKCSNFCHQQRECRGHTKYNHAQNKNRSLYGLSRKYFVPLGEIICYRCNNFGHTEQFYRSTKCKRRKNQINKKNIVYYNCNNFGHTTKYCRTKAIKQRKNMNVTLDIATEKKKEINEVWRRKYNSSDKRGKKDETMRKHYAVHVHVISPQI